jgi:hypothetical protein
LISSENRMKYFGSLTPFESWINTNNIFSFSGPQFFWLFPWECGARFSELRIIKLWVLSTWDFEQETLSLSLSLSVCLSVSLSLCLSLCNKVVTFNWNFLNSIFFSNKFQQRCATDSFNESRMIFIKVFILKMSLFRYFTKVFNECKLNTYYLDKDKEFFSIDKK